MAADGSSGRDAARDSVAKIAVAAAKESDQSLDHLAETYFNRLLKNIELMLTYVMSNGIVVPDDLRMKIDMLLTHSELVAHTATIPHPDAPLASAAN